MSDILHRLNAALAGRYTIERELGAGGMATVFLAHDVKHDRKIALKVLSPDLAAVIGPERFLREIHVTARLAHPHILPLLDSGDADGLLYYTMPVVDGESLRERMDRDPQLPVELAMEISAEVADALDRAHEHGVVHRDIKPENILLDGPHALVADFGIAGMTGGSEHESLTATGLAVGTCQYMSPEQISAEKVDGRSDVYSLACVTYEMIAGRPVFTGATAESIARQHLTTDPIPLTTLRSALPETVDTVLRKALAKAPVDRYATGAEYVAALRGAVEAAVPPPGATTQGRSLPGRAMLAVAAIVALGVAGILLIPKFTQSPTITSLAVLPLENLSGDEDQDYFVDGIHDALTTELKKLSAWRVTSRTSAMRYRNSDLAPADIARELGVDALMEGTVIHLGNAVRLSVSLVAMSPDSTVWSGSYERSVGDVLTLMREITSDVAAEIALTLTQGERTLLAEARPIDPAALDAYLLGRFYWNQRSIDGFRLARDHFSRAIDIDSGYAAAWAGLSDTYNLMAQYSHMSLEDAIPAALQAADRAIEADSTMPEPYTSMGEVYALSREWQNAETAYRRAIALDPTSSQGHHFLGWFLSHLGRHDEALEHISEAIDLDPLDPTTIVDYAAALMHSGQIADARPHVQRALSLQPDHVWALWVGGVLALADGDSAQAMDFARRWEAADPAYDYRLHAHVFAATGQYETARQVVLEQVARVGGRENVAPFLAASFATTITALGDNDEALSWLELAVDKGLASGPISPLVWPFFDPLRSDPRFDRILERMGYPR